MRESTFVVYGTPRPKGSKTLGRTKTGNVFMRESSPGLPEWMQAVRQAAEANQVHWPPHTPVSVTLLFMFVGPKRQPTGWMTVAPDIDKLTRAVLDALQQGKLLADDARVASVSATKVFGAQAGCRVTVRDMPAWSPTLHTRADEEDSA